MGRTDLLCHKRVVIEKEHTRSKEEKYICFLDKNLAWLPEELEKVKRYWAYGLHIGEIVERTGRYEIEVVILLLDLAEQGKIKPREGGVLGFEIKVEGVG